jgi:oligosaccharide repeat unit polymerase
LIILSILFLVYSLFISFKINKFYPKGISPTFLFTIVSICFINIGHIYYYIKYSEYYNWASKPLLVTSIGLFIICVSSLIHHIVFSKILSVKNNTNVKYEYKLENYKIIFLISLSVFIFVLIYYILLGYIPLFAAIKELVSDGLKNGLMNTKRVERDIYVNEDAKYIPLQGFFEQMRYFGLPVVIFLNLFYLKKTKLSHVMIAVAILLIISSGQRWPLMYALTGVFVYYSYIINNQKKFLKTSIKVFVLALLAGCVLSILLGRNLEHTDIGMFGTIFFGLSDLLTRIATGNVEIPFFSYSIIPYEVDYFYGWTWVQNLIAYFPGPYPSFPVDFYKLVTKDPIGYTAPPDFYTEAYINYSWIGVIFTCFLWGSVLFFIGRSILFVENNIFKLSYKVLIITLIAFSAFSGIMFIFGGIIIIIFIELIRILINIIVKDNPSSP